MQPSTSRASPVDDEAQTLRHCRDTAGRVTGRSRDGGAASNAVRPPIKAWDVPDVQRFLVVAAHDSYSPLWLIALHGGMRRGELLGLRRQDIDFGRGVLRVQQILGR